jgi:hypothetical protein
MRKSGTSSSHPVLCSNVRNRKFAALFCWNMPKERVFEKAKISPWTDAHFEFDGPGGRSALTRMRK